MILNGLFTQRKVPREKDGRSDEQKQRAEYREHRSLWYEIDEQKMYPQARRLRQSGFQCRPIILGVLLRGTYAPRILWLVVTQHIWTLAGTITDAACRS